MITTVLLKRMGGLEIKTTIRYPVRKFTRGQFRRQKLFAEKMNTLAMAYGQTITRTGVSRWNSFTQVQPMKDGDIYRYKGYLVYTEGGYFVAWIGTKRIEKPGIGNLLDVIDDFHTNRWFEEVMRKVENEHTEESAA